MAENDGHENNERNDSENSNPQLQQSGTTRLPSMPIPATGPSAEVQAEYSTEYARRGLQRYPGPVDADNVDSMILSGDHVLDDMLGQGQIATDFAKLLEEGEEGDQRQKVKTFLEANGIPASAMDTSSVTNQQGRGDPFETGGPMSGMYGPGRGGMISQFGNDFDTQRISRGGGYIPYSARRQAGQNMRNPMAQNFGADPRTVPPVPQVNSGQMNGTLSSQPGNGALPMSNGNQNELVSVGRGSLSTNSASARPTPSNAPVPGDNATGTGRGLGPNSPLLPRNPGQTIARGPLNNMNNMGMGGYGGAGGGLSAYGGGRGSMGSMMPYQHSSAGRGSEALNQLIEEERRRALECPDSMGQGLNTFILLDNSISMAGEGFEQAKNFIENFLQGLEENSMDCGLEENVSLITFGGDQARVEQHLTNEFQCLRSKLDAIQCYGSANLSHALILVTGGLDRGFGMVIGNHSIVPRILLLTKGVFAIAGLHGMTGMVAGGGRGQDFTETAQVLQNVLQSHNMKLFFIPVGNANMEFKAIMQNFPATKVVEASDLKIVTRNHIHHRIAGDVTELGGGGNVSRDIVRDVAARSFTDLEDRDFNVVLELLHEDQQHEIQRRQQRGGGGPGGGGMGGGGMGGYGGGSMGGLEGRGMGGLGSGMGGYGGGGMVGLGGGGMGGLGDGGMGLQGSGMGGYGGGGMGRYGGGGMGGYGGGRIGGLGGGGRGLGGADMGLVNMGDLGREEMGRLRGDGMVGFGREGMGGLGGDSMSSLGGGGIGGQGGRGFPGLRGAGMGGGRVLNNNSVFQAPGPRPGFP